ncbi:hypothetical protein [Salinisphaera orenii]|uniref:hypothetical protein n=1 Tax=Salinisphaera orenii TaxID=856731 RepID=UPI000DBEA1DA
MTDPNIAEAEEKARSAADSLAAVNAESVSTDRLADIWQVLSDALRAIDAAGAARDDTDDDMEL